MMADSNTRSNSVSAGTEAGTTGRAAEHVEPKGPQKRFRQRQKALLLSLEDTVKERQAEYKQALQENEQASAVSKLIM